MKEPGHPKLLGPHGVGEGEDTVAVALAHGADEDIHEVERDPRASPIRCQRCLVQGSRFQGYGFEFRIRRLGLRV